MARHSATTVIIAEPYTEILGGPDIYLEEGFTMNLTCLVRDSPEPPQYIFWWVSSETLNNKQLKNMSICQEKMKILPLYGYQ